MLVLLGLMGSCQAAQSATDAIIESCVGGSEAVVSATNDTNELVETFVTIGYYDDEGVQLDSEIFIITVPAGRTAMERGFPGAVPFNTSRCEIIEVNTYAG